jgi:hypothetical protein
MPELSTASPLLGDELNVPELLKSSSCDDVRYSSLWEKRITGENGLTIPDPRISENGSQSDIR